MLSKEQLLAAKNSQAITIVSTPVGDIGIKVMSGAEREAWENQAFKDGKVNLELFRPKLLAKVLCNENGERLFTDDEFGSISELPSTILLTLFDKAMKVNALKPDDVDEMTKN